MNNSTFIRNILSSARSCASRYNYSTDFEAIQIPKRIQRGPTDILKALARVHKRDVTAPNYKYHDDPYLIPYSNSNKRSYALSLEAGRKAAHWIRQEHAELFNHSVADPPVELFFPTKVYKEDTEVTLEDLKKTISEYSVSDSITVYNCLEKQGIEVDAELKQSLLELLCYYNAEDSVSNEWLEERWFKSTKKRDLFRKTWKDNGVAEKLFLSIKPPTAEAYCAIISGMAKYGQVDGAMKLFDEANANNLVLNTDVYNCILARVSSLRENHSLMWKLTLELVSSMKLKGFIPTLGTFNAILETLSHMVMNRNAKKFALQVIKEMKECNIEPSLASFYHIINIYYGGQQNSGILHDIIDYLEGKSFSARDINDSLFFVTAMEMCRHKLHQVSLGYRIDNLLHHHDNYNLIGDSFRESQYYRYFFSLLCEGEPLDEFLVVYDKLVPHFYTPEPSVMMEVLNSVEVNLGYKHIPKLWTDMTMFDLTERQPLLIKVLELMNQTDDEKLNEQFINIGWNIWEKIEKQTRERNAITWTGGMLSDLLKLFVKNKEMAKANLILDKLDRNQNNLTGEPETAALRLYVASCIENQSPDMAIKSIRYCKDMGFGEAEELSMLVETSLTLSEPQKQRLNAIMGRSPIPS